MRITNNRITRNYLANLNRNMELYNGSYEKLASGHAFTRVSENVSGGRKALELRTQAYRNEQYQNNVNTALEQLTISETALRSIGDVMVTVKEKSIKASSVNDQTSLDVYAETMKALKGNILQFSNSAYVDKYVLGGTNGKTEPFSVDENGDFLFNGTRTEDIVRTADGYVDKNGNLVAMSNDVYVDVGLGIKITGGQVNEATAFKISTSGLESLGFGTSEMTYEDKDGNTVTETVPDNVYQIISEMEDSLKDGNRERLSALNDHLTKSYDNLMKNVSDLGVKSQYLETMQAKYKEEQTAISEMQTNLEGIKDENEIINLSEYKYSWLLTLQFGSSILPQTLMDYLD